MLRLMATPVIAGALCCVPVAAHTPAAGMDMTVTGALRGITRTQTVSLGDLNLRRDAHVARADSRIRSASKQVCDTSATQDLYQKRDYRLCFDQALTSARGELDRHVALARSN